MKKILSVLMGLMVILLVACSNGEDTTNEESGKIKVLTSTTFITDLVSEIGGNNIEVEGLMGSGVDPHGYSPATSDILKLAEADMIVYNGLHLEANLVDVFEQIEGNGTPTVVLADAISSNQYLESEDDTLESDPHIWFSVPIWQNATQHVADALSTYDPENAETYEANAERYIHELEELDSYIRSRVEEVPEGERYLVTAHDAFNYFGAEYGFDVVGIQGLNTSTEAGTGDFSELSDFIVEKDIRAVFVESSVSSRNIDALIEAVEARGHEISLGGELYSDSLGTSEEGADTYISMYKHNIDTIVDGLK